MILQKDLIIVVFICTSALREFVSKINDINYFINKQQQFFDT